MIFMTSQLQRPAMKSISEKVTDEDMIYFSLGVDKKEDFILPSERNSYLNDEKAVALVRAIHNGEKFVGQDFSGLNLKGADLSEGYFKECNFSNAIFYNTKMRFCHLEGADFSGAYLENSDFSDAHLEGASFAHAFVRDTTFTKENMDEETVAYITELEKLIHLIEQGKVDLRTLSKSDLLHLDVRRIDFTNVDLTEIDLSVFALDGVNLMGTYIDPKQVMSREGLAQYYMDLRQMKEKKLIELEKELIKARDEALRELGRKNQENNNLVTYQNADKKPKVRPRGKGIVTLKSETVQTPQSAQAPVHEVKKTTEQPIIPNIPKPVEMPTPLAQKPAVPKERENKPAGVEIDSKDKTISVANNDVMRQLLNISLGAKTLEDSSNTTQQSSVAKTDKPKEQSEVLADSLKTAPKNEALSIIRPEAQQSVARPTPVMIIRGERNEFTEKQEERERIAQEQKQQEQQTQQVLLQQEENEKRLKEMQDQTQAKEQEDDSNKIQISLDKLEEILAKKDTEIKEETLREDLLDNSETELEDNTQSEEESQEESEEEKKKKKPQDDQTEDSVNSKDPFSASAQSAGSILGDMKKVAQRGVKMKKMRFKTKA